jgi:hypothetical protein
VELSGTSHRLIEVVADTATSRRTRGAARSWTTIRAEHEAVCVEERYEVAAGWITGRAHGPSRTAKLSTTGAISPGGSGRTRAQVPYGGAGTRAAPYAGR